MSGPVGNASIRVVRLYVSTRCRPRIIVLLPALLVLAAALAKWRPPDATIFVDHLIACLLVVALRIIDDLADRAHDAPREPDRIACQPDAAGPLSGLALGASIVAALLLAASRPWPAILVVGAAYALVAGWYALRDRCQASRLVNSHVVLAKYPLLVVALALPPRDTWDADAVLRIGLPALLCYLTLILFELRDDRDLSGDPRAVWCWRIEAVGWVAAFVVWIGVRFA